MQKEKIIIINISNIGDIVSSLSVVKVISNMYDIDFFTKSAFHSLLSSETYLNLIDEKALKVNKYKKLIDLTSSSESRKIVKLVLNTEKKIGMYKSIFNFIKQRFYYNKLVKKNKFNHIVKDYYPILDVLNKIDITSLEPYPVLHIDTTMSNQLKNENYVTIHIGARNPIRAIPFKLLSELFILLHESYGYKIYLLGDDIELINTLLSKYSFLNYSKTDLNQVKVMIKNSILFIGPDSGLLHIASALNTKSIGLYGPNIKEICGPLNESVIIVDKSFSCRPCNQNIKCPYDIRCLKEIEINDIKNAINKVLQ